MEEINLEEITRGTVSYMDMFLEAIINPDDVPRDILGYQVGGWVVNYTLEIDYHNCSEARCREILDILWTGSSDCYGDIVELSREALIRLNRVNYSIRDISNNNLVILVKSLFRILDEIGNITEKETIKEYFNKFLKGRPNSPAISPLSSPNIKTRMVPKIMKKAFRKN
jgi:hypothetical protein